MNTNNDVVDAFMHRMKLSSQNLSSTGDKLMSYNTCIIQRFVDAETVYVINMTRYSSTTSRHRNSAYKMIQKENCIMCFVHDIPINTRDLSNVRF
jgi:hypothetical protein